MKSDFKVNQVVWYRGAKYYVLRRYEVEVTIRQAFAPYMKTTVLYTDIKAT